MLAESKALRLALVFLSGALTGIGAALRHPGLPERSVGPKLQCLPFYFEANRGQTDDRVGFLARGSGYRAFVMPTELMLALPVPSRDREGAVSTTDQPYVSMTLAGANAQAGVRGLEPLPGKVNYFLGNDPQRWLTRIPTFGRIEAGEVYPGIDMVYYGVGRGIAFDAMVKPGADPAALRLVFEGATRAQIDARGDLVLDTGSGELRLSKPHIYQTAHGARTIVPGSYVLHEFTDCNLESRNLQSRDRKGADALKPFSAPCATTSGGGTEVGVQVGAYDHTRLLVIDPVLTYSTYLGGGGDDVGYDIAVDSLGQMYVTGPTDSPNFPTRNPVQPNFGGGANSGDAFVVKLTADGSALVYGTYLGGTSDDFGQAVAVDAAGQAHVTGRAGSQNFPLANPFQNICYMQPGGTCQEAFVTKLSTEGATLVYSTFLGGTESDGGSDIAVDAAGNAYVAGFTSSADFPVVNPIHGKKGTLADGFVTKLNAQGSALVYSTFLGGTEYEGVDHIALDLAGNAYLFGSTGSVDFPMVLPLQPKPAGGTDGFVAKLNPAGSALVYSTYLGGSDTEETNGIAVDAAGAVYLTGGTTSHNFPLEKPLQAVNRGGANGYDAFITKINAAGSALVYSTYLGGNGDESSFGIAVDAGGFAYIAGFTQSLNFPVVKPWQPAYGGGLREAFVSKLTPTGSALVFSTYLGGGTDDSGRGIALGPEGSVHITGRAGQPGTFPTVNPFQPLPGQGPGLKDGFISRFSQTLAPEVRLQPVVVTFGVVPVGGARSAPFLVHNDGDLDLTVTQILSVAPLTLLGPQPPFTVRPGESATVWLRWRPLTAGPLQKTILIASNDPDEAVKGVLVTGTAVPGSGAEGGIQ